MIGDLVYAFVSSHFVTIQTMHGDMYPCLLHEYTITISFSFRQPKPPTHAFLFSKENKNREGINGQKSFQDIHGTSPD